MDPLIRKYPFYSSFQFAGNTVIESRELEGLEPSHTAATSPAEGKSEATLEDGDYFSDVQMQTYCVVFKSVSQEKFNEVFSKFKTDPGSVINNDRAQYRLVDRDGSYGVTVQDHFDITIDGGPDGFVVVKTVVELENSVSVQVQTLEGHPDAGTNTFVLAYDAASQSVTWQTQNISRTNDNLTGGLGAGVMEARSKQQAQWKDVALKVHSSFGSPEVLSANAYIEEFDYNDATNTIGKREDDECFEEDFSSTFPKK